MKRILALLVCLMMIFSITACKPDNITPPVEIVDPNQQPEESETPVEEETPETNETPAEDAEGEGEDTPAEEETDTPAESTQPEDTAEVPQQITNPLAAEDYQPATGAASTLTASGIVKPGASVSALKNRTIVLYTANDQPAFTYTDENGKTVTEWAWMEKIAAEQGFMLKYTIKSKAVSLKSQRVALYAGKKLSLVQMSVDELAAGLTLSRSAVEYLNTAAETFGISKSVLAQSNNTLFAPVGNANTLWYNSALMPEGQDPNTLSQSNGWTVEQFKAAYNYAVEQKALPLLLEETLAWATLSGKSPLTLAEGKLDSNIHAKATREVWDALKTMNASLTAFQKTEGTSYTVAGGNVAFSYTAAPETAKGLTLNYAPLPSLTEGTAGTVTYTGTFLALPKYEENSESILAALSFAELWCNRYTEARAAKLQSLGITGAAYQQYCDLTETCGHLILHDAAIEKAAATYLSGLTDATVDMETAYGAAEDQLLALIATKNLYY
ncbi:MAG: hypothetical protein IJ043_04540 [Clostridia bacterium]|nr:hypothetical protein [Clostridia bacterium]